MINRRIVINILLLILVVGGAFLFEKVLKIQGSQSGQLVPVVHKEKTIAYLDAGVIRQLSDQERDLQQGRGVSGSANAVSLSFVLGSVGIDDYAYVQVTGLGDSKSCKLKLEEAKDIVLSANSNGTFAMVNVADGHRIIVNEVVGFYATD